MAWGGSTSGQFHGAWFGAQGEADPGALDAELHGIGSLTATATAIGWLNALLSGTGNIAGALTDAAQAIAPDWIVLARRRGKR